MRIKLDENLGNRGAEILREGVSPGTERRLMASLHRNPARNRCVGAQVIEVLARDCRAER